MAPPPGKTLQQMTVEERLKHGVEFPIGTLWSRVSPQVLEALRARLSEIVRMLTSTYLEARDALDAAESAGGAFDDLQPVLSE